MPHWMFEPLSDAPSRMGRRLRDYLDNPATATGDRGLFKPFVAGAMEGTGDVISDMTSPFSLLTMGAGKAATGLKNIAQLRKLSALSKAPISPSFYNLGPEFAPATQEAMNSFNSLRKAEQAAKAAKLAEEAYENSLAVGKIPNIAPNVDVVDMMQRIAKARGR